MKTNRLFILAATSLLMLSACGSKGGASSTQTSSQQTSSQQQSSEIGPASQSEQQSSEQQSEQASSQEQQSSEEQQSSQEQQSSESSEEQQSSQEQQSSEAPSQSEQQSSEQGGGIDPENIITEPTTITVWTTYNDTYQAIINACADELQKTYPNITVNNVKQQGSYDDLKNMCISGFAVDNYPDLVAAYPDSVADFINNDKALDVQDLMYKDVIGWTDVDF